MASVGDMELRVVRVTDRFDQACTLYGEVLGWPVTKAWDEPQRGRIFGYGDAGRVELMEATAATTVPPVTGVFVAFEVADVDALHRRLVAAGITIVRPPTDQPWGHRNITFADPSGLELVAFQILGG